MRAVALACVLLGACGAGDGIVELTVTTRAGTQLPRIFDLTVTVAECTDETCKSTVGAGSEPISVPVGATLPPDVSVALRFGARHAGFDLVTVVAQPDNQPSTAAVRASTVVEVKASDRQSATIELPGSMAPPPDMAAPPPCNPVIQTGCDSGDKCVPGGSCQPNGAVGIGAACLVGVKQGQTDNCAGGATCNVGACRQMCNADGDCLRRQSPVGNNNIARCVDFASSSPARCSTPCNPVLAAGASGCPTGLKCIYTTNFGVEYTTCTTPGTATLGQLCGNGVQCAEGAACVTGSITACRPYCRVATGPTDCGSQVSRPFNCVPLAGPSSGALGLGVCCPDTGC